MELPVCTPEERAEIKRLWNRWCAEVDTPLAAEVRTGHARGWSFTPLNGKKPVLLDWQARPRADLETCVRWARAGNVGIRTGTASGVAVLDVDEAKGGRLPCPIPVTPTVETGGGGKHYYYSIPDGIEIRNSVGRIAPHVDVRGDGGQVVYPGSVHPETGAFYEWAEGLSPDDVPLVPFPAHLLELLERAAPVPPPAAPTAYELRSRYLERALRDEVASVATAPEGTRNDTLNRAAFNLGQLVGAGLDESAVVSELLHAAVSAGLPEREARATVASGLGDGKQHPRTVPERSEPPRSAPVSTGPVSSAPEPLQAAEAPAFEAPPFADLASWPTGEPPAPRWIFDRCLRRGIVAGLAARGGAGKSWFLLELATSLAIGRRLIPSFEPLAPGRVLALFGEDDADEVHRRWKRVVRVFGLSEDDQRTFAENARFVCGWRAPFMHDCSAPRPTRAFEWLLSQVEAERPDLVILDPKSQFFGLNENDNDQTVQWYTNLARLIRCLDPAPSVVVCQHVSKAKQEDSDDGAARGASANRDDVRAFWSMTGITPAQAKHYGITNPNLFVQVEHTKASYTDRSPDPVILQRQTDSPTTPEHLSRGGVLVAIDAKARAAETSNALLSQLQRAIVEVLGNNPNDLSKKELCKNPAGAGFRESVQERVPPATVFDIKVALEDAIRTGEIVVEERSVKGGTKLIPRVAE